MKGHRKIAICFYGITRSLGFTADSILGNIIAPARDLAEVKIFGHFYRMQRIDNPRSGEKGVTVGEDYHLLPFGGLQTEDPVACLSRYPFREICAWGDWWGDDYRSLTNLIHQLHSLRTVHEASREFGANVTVFARPDLLYYDTFHSALERALDAGRDLVQVPRWQPFGGLNDRFAVTSGTAAAEAVATRVDLALEYCEKRQAPLHSEQLLAYAVAARNLPVELHSLRAGRVRANGARAKEIFDHRLSGRIAGNVRFHLQRGLDAVGLGLEKKRDQ